MEQGGSSLFLSAISTLGAILISIATQIEGVRSFLIYTAVAILLHFIFTMTVYAAFLALDLRRQINNKGDWCGGCRCRGTNPVFCCGKIRNFEARGRQSRQEFQTIIHNQSIDNLDKNDTN